MMVSSMFGMSYTTNSTCSLVSHNLPEQHFSIGRAGYCFPRESMSGVPPLAQGHHGWAQQMMTNADHTVIDQHSFYYDHK